ncbi:MAG: NAD(P)/FAD-dependent oxidoreductase [Candidatus Omnitrophota bacterium]|nr:NAD(P)/FAD-dependent oxidoreductase [Candidatus Omnitrophota bacterium]
MQRYRILIVGGGPAGMMAAIRAAQLGDGICLLEKNNCLGKKLLISGKGRCNLTNVGDIDNFLNNFSKSGEFLRDAFKALPNTALMDFFEENGLRLKTERGGRVFPDNDKSASVLQVLKSRLQNKNVEIIYSSPVQSIICKDKIWQVILRDGRVFVARKVILATGGASYAATGSDGFGFKLAASLGHKVVPLRPGLVPLEVKEDFMYSLSGLSLKNVAVSFNHRRNKWQSDIGEMLFTHFGVSGPLILEASSKIIDWFKDKEPVALSIDFKPGLSGQQLEERLLRDFKDMGSKTFKNILKELLPTKLIDNFVMLSNIPADKKAHQVTQAERMVIGRLLKDFRLTIIQSRPLDEAIVTRGGVSTKEINPKTMESRINPGLYFCGEIIDVDAATGGYNMQAAFSTGWLAGENAAKSLN